jgi:hypothetical protein
MGFTSATRDLVLGGASVASLCTHASLHTADPGTSGASEITGGSYTRVAITWQAPSGGSETLTAVATLQIPAGTTFGYFGLWSAVSAGTFRGGDVLTGGAQSYPTGGTFDLSVTINTA